MQRIRKSFVFDISGVPFLIDRQVPGSVFDISAVKSRFHWYQNFLIVVCSNKISFCLICLISYNIILTLYKMVKFCRIWLYRVSYYELVIVFVRVFPLKTFVRLKLNFDFTSSRTSIPIQNPHIWQKLPYSAEKIEEARRKVLMTLGYSASKK